MKKFTVLKTCLLVLATFAMIPLHGQINIPDLSPRCQLVQSIGFGKVKVDYSRPSMNKRVVFGEVVPFGQIWRTGANKATLITFSEDVLLNDHKVSNGTYSLFTVPGKKVWTIILNRNTNLWGTDNYDEAKDYLRFEVKTAKLTDHVESFTIDIVEHTRTTANIMISWENTLVKFKIGTYADQIVVAEIEQKLKNPMTDVANTYYAAATYYLDTHRDIDQAMTWVNKSMEIGGEDGYKLLLKAKIYAEKSQYQRAIQHARKSIDMASMDENQKNLVIAAEKLVDKWKMSPN
ncbi:MAG: DUF2911 domain-containing protein [Saprospiraceae bacterium]|nr:DUF2911 domain-containing protein [Saprospiraceae bacterium]